MSKRDDSSVGGPTVMEGGDSQQAQIVALAASSTLGQDRVKHKLWAVNERAADMVAGAQFSKRLIDHGVHADRQFGPVPFLVKTAHPTVPQASLNNRIPAESLADIHAKQTREEHLLAWQEEQFALQTQEKNEVLTERTQMLKALEASKASKTSDAVAQMKGMSSVLRDTEPVLKEYSASKTYYEGLHERREVYHQKTLREHLGVVEGRAMDYSFGNETFRQLLDSSPEDYKVFCNAYNRLDAVVEGAKIHVPSRWHFVLWGLTAPLAGIGRVFLRCGERTFKVDEEGITATSSFGRFCQKAAYVRDSLPFILGGWLGLTHIFIAIAHGNNYAIRRLRERKVNRKRRKQKYHLLRRAYLRQEPYGGLAEAAERIDAYQGLPWRYNRFVAGLLRFGLGSKDNAFAEKRKKRDAYFATENAIPTGWHMFWHATAKNLSYPKKWLGLISSDLADERRGRYSNKRKTRALYLEQGKTLNALDLGIRGLVKYRPSVWVTVWGVESFVNLLRLAFFPFLWLFGVWQKGNPIKLARRSRTVWLSDIDRLLLAVNARATEHRRGLAQFNAFAMKNLKTDQLTFEPDDKMHKVEDPTAHALRRLSRKDVDVLLETLRHRYSDDVARLKPNNERRQAYANIIYSLATKAPELLLTDNPLVEVPDALLGKLANTSEGAGRQAMVDSFSDILIKQPTFIIDSIAALLHVREQEAPDATESEVSDDELDQAVDAKKQEAKYAFTRFIGRMSNRIGNAGGRLWRSITNVFRRPKRHDAELLYSHREFLDITYERAMHSLANRIEILRSIKARLESADSPNANVVINVKNYSLFDITRALEACSAYAKIQFQNSNHAVYPPEIDETSAEIIKHLGELIKVNALIDCPSIDLVFCRLGSDAQRTYKASIEHRDLPAFVVFDHDLQGLSGLTRIDGLAQDSWKEVDAPSHAGEVMRLWAEQEPQIMKLHTAIMAKARLAAVDLRPKYKGYLEAKEKRFLGQLALTTPLALLRKIVSEAGYEKGQTASIRLDKDSCYILRSPSENIDALSECLLEKFNAARSNGERVIELEIVFDQPDGTKSEVEIHQISLPALITPSETDLLYFSAVMEMNADALDRFCEDSAIQKIAQGQGICNRADADGDVDNIPDAGGVGQAIAEDTRKIIDAYRALMAQTQALLGDNAEYHALFGVKQRNQSGEEEQHFDALTRTLVDLYARLRDRSLTSIEYTYDISPRLSQVLARLLNSGELEHTLGEGTHALLSEFNDRINLQNVSPASNAFIDRLADLMHINVFQKQNPVLPTEKDPAKDIIRSVLGANALLKWSCATESPDALSDPLAVLARPPFEAAQRYCLFTTEGTKDENGLFIPHYAEGYTKIAHLPYVEKPESILHKRLHMVMDKFNLMSDHPKPGEIIKGLFDAMLTAYRKGFDTIPAAIKTVLVDQLAVFWAGSSEEIAILLRDVSISPDFAQAVSLVINQLATLDLPEPTGSVLSFWQLIVAFTHEIQVDHSHHKAYVHKRVLELRGIDPRSVNIKNATESIVEAMHSTVANTTIFKMVCPPAARQVIEATVRADDNGEGISLEDALEQCLNLLPVDYAVLIRSIGKMDGHSLHANPLVSLHRHDGTSKYVFRLGGVGLADPRLWSKGSVVFKNAKDANQPCYVTLLQLYDLLCAHIPERGAVKAIHFDSGDARLLSTDAGFAQDAERTPMEWHQAIDMTFVDARSAQLFVRDNDVVQYLRSLLTTLDRGRTSPNDLHVYCLASGEPYKLFPQLDAIVNALARITEDGIVNHADLDKIDFKFIFAAAAKWLPMVPNRPRAVYFSKIVGLLLEVNQQWHEHCKKGSSPLHIARSVHLFRPYDSASAAKYRGRVHALLAAASPVGSFNHNYSARIARNFLSAPEGVSAGRQFADALAVTSMAMGEFDQYLRVHPRGLSLFPSTITERNFHQAAIDVNSLLQPGLETSFNPKAVLPQVIAYGRTVLQQVKHLAIEGSDGDFGVALRIAADHRNKCMESLSKRALSIPGNLLLVVMDEARQLAAIRKIVNADPDKSPIANAARCLFSPNTMLATKGELLKGSPNADLHHAKCKADYYEEATLPGKYGESFVRTLLARFTPTRDGNPREHLIELLNVVHSVQFAFAFGANNVADTMLDEGAKPLASFLNTDRQLLQQSTDFTEEGIREKIHKIVSLASVRASNSRLCEILPPFSLEIARGAIEQYVDKATQALSAFKTAGSAEDVREAYARIDFTVTLCAHLGFADLAQKLIQSFLENVVNQYNVNAHKGLQDKNHPVRQTLRRWASDPVLRRTVASINADWIKAKKWDVAFQTSINDVVGAPTIADSIGRKLGQQTIAKASDQILALMFVSELLAVTGDANGDNPQGSIAWTGGQIIQNVVRSVVACASNGEYTDLIKQLSSGEFCNNEETHWVWRLVVSNYKEAVQKIKQKGSDGESAKTLLEDIQPYLIIFQTCFRIIGARGQKDVLELGALLLTTLMAFATSRDFPDGDMLEKIELGLARHAQLQTGKGNAYAILDGKGIDLEALVDATEAYAESGSAQKDASSLSLDKMLKPMVASLKRQYDDTYGTPANSDIGSKFKQLVVGRNEPVPTIPVFIMQVLRLFAQSNLKAENSFAPWISMLYGLGACGHILEAARTGFAPENMSQAAQLDNCQAFGLLGPEQLNKIAIIVGDTKLGNVARMTYNDVLPAKQDQVGQSIIAWYGDGNDRLPLLSFLPAGLVFSLMKRGTNRSSLEDGLLEGNEAGFFGGTTRARLQPFAMTFFPIIDAWLRTDVFTIKPFLPKPGEKQLTAHSLLNMVARGDAQQLLRLTEEAIQDLHLRAAPKQSEGQFNSVQELYFDRLALCMAHYQLQRIDEGSRRAGNVGGRISDGNALIQVLSARIQEHTNAMDVHAFEHYFSQFKRRFPLQLRLTSIFENLSAQLGEECVALEEEALLVKLCLLVTRHNASKSSFFAAKAAGLIHTVLTHRKPANRLTALKKIHNALFDTPKRAKNIYVADVTPAFAACFSMQGGKSGLNRDAGSALRSLISDAFETHVSHQLMAQKTIIDEYQQGVLSKIEDVRAAKGTAAKDQLIAYQGTIDRFSGPKVPKRVQASLMKLMEQLVITSHAYDAVFDNKGNINKGITETSPKWKAFEQSSNTLLSLYGFFAQQTDDEVHWRDVLRVNRLLPGGIMLDSGYETSMYEMAMKMRVAIPVPNALLLTSHHIPEQASVSIARPTLRDQDRGRFEPGKSELASSVGKAGPGKPIVTERDQAEVTSPARRSCSASGLLGRTAGGKLVTGMLGAAGKFGVKARRPSEPKPGAKPTGQHSEPADTDTEITVATP